MSDNTMFVRIDGEPFLSAAKAYKSDLENAQAEWSHFAKSIGADGFWFHGAFAFKSFVPEGWVRPASNGASRPKKTNKEARAKIAALPTQPTTRAVFGDKIKETYSYTASRGNSGGGCIARLWEPQIGWTASGIFVAAIPDPAPVVKEIRKQYPSAKFTCGCDKWKLPRGLTRISEAEKEFIFARDALNAEKRAA